MKLSSEAEAVYRVQDYGQKPQIDGLAWVELKRHGDEGGWMTELIRPGGTALVLEITPPSSRLTHQLFGFYLKALVPAITRIGTRIGTWIGIRKLELHQDQEQRSRVAAGNAGSRVESGLAARLAPALLVAPLVRQAPEHGNELIELIQLLAYVGFVQVPPRRSNS